MAISCACIYLHARVSNACYVVYHICEAVGPDCACVCLCVVFVRHKCHHPDCRSPFLSSVDQFHPTKHWQFKDMLAGGELLHTKLMVYMYGMSSEVLCI